MRESYKLLLSIASGEDLKKRLNAQKSLVNRAETLLQTILPTSAKWSSWVPAQSEKLTIMFFHGMPAI